MIVKCKRETFVVSHYKNIFQHFLGLMFKFPSNDGILMEFREEKNVALHTFFMLIKIDVVYLNKEKRVIKILKKVKPFIPYIKSTKCKYILELKNSKNIKIKDKIIIVY